MGDDNDFGRFHLLERIGAGGMGEVFRAEMRGTDGFTRIVVVKRMLPDLAADADAVASFVHEAKLAARIIHPNVVQVHDFGKVGARYFLVMEYVAGCDLSRLLAMQRMQERKLAPSAAVAIAAALLNGLEYAHALRDGDGQPLYLVHRDVTPGNVLLGTAGEIKLSDFGIAKTRERLEHTRVGAVKGKWNYMSPEQARGASWIDARSDLFAVGIVLYEMLTAERPFKGKTGRDVAAAVQSGRYPAPEGIGPGLTEVIARALQTKIEARYQSARGFREVLLARAAADGITPDPDLLRTLVEETAVAFATPPMPPRPASTEPAASNREATDVMEHESADAVATAPARRPPPVAPRLPPAEVINEPTPVAAAIQQPHTTATSVSVVIKPKHFVIGGVALGLLVVATFVVAARISHIGSKPHTVRVALRMYPAQEQWFVEHVFQPFAKREGCKVEIVEFNSTEELTRIIANGEADMSKIDIEHAPVLVELGQLQRLSALGERVDPQGYAELIGQLRPEALQIGRFHTTVGDDLYMLPRKLETLQLAYRPSLVALAAAEWAKQRAALDKRLEGVLGHGLPEGFDLSPDPAKWTSWDRVAAAWVWARTPIDGRTEPRFAVRPERAMMEAVSGGATGSEPWRTSPALVDVFFTYAVLRELDLLNAESLKPEGDWLRLRDLLAHKALAAFDEVQIDIGILTGNGHGLPQLIDDPKDLDVAPLPRLANLASGSPAAQESRSEVWGWGWGVPRNSREPELAMKLIMTILSHDRHAAELEEFPILRVRKDVTPAWPIARRVNEVGDAQLANGRRQYVEWPRHAGDLERNGQRILKAYRELIVERHYGSADHPIDRAVIEAKLHQILDVTD